MKVHWTRPRLCWKIKLRDIPKNAFLSFSKDLLTGPRLNFGWILHCWVSHAILKRLYQDFLWVLIPLGSPMLIWDMCIGCCSCSLQVLCLGLFASARWDFLLVTKTLLQCLLMFPIYCSNLNGSLLFGRMTVGRLWWMSSV